MKNNKSDNTQEVQEKMIEQILRTGGYVLPSSDFEFEEFERIYGTTNVILPDELLEPTFLYLDEKKKPLVKTKEIYNNELAMAARQGGEELPEEIKKRMEQDRRNADLKKKRKR